MSEDKRKEWGAWANTKRLVERDRMERGMRDEGGQTEGECASVGFQSHSLTRALMGLHEELKEMHDALSRLEERVKPISEPEAVEVLEKAEMLKGHHLDTRSEIVCEVDAARQAVTNLNARLYALISRLQV